MNHYNRLQNASWLLPPILDLPRHYRLNHNDLGSFLNSAKQGTKQNDDDDNVDDHPHHPHHPHHVQYVFVY